MAHVSPLMETCPPSFNSDQMRKGATQTSKDLGVFSMNGWMDGWMADACKRRQTVAAGPLIWLPV